MLTRLLTCSSISYIVETTPSSWVERFATVIQLAGLAVDTMLSVDSHQRRHIIVFTPNWLSEFRIYKWCLNYLQRKGYQMEQMIMDTKQHEDEEEEEKEEEGGTSDTDVPTAVTAQKEGFASIQCYPMNVKEKRHAKLATSCGAQIRFRHSSLKFNRGISGDVVFVQDFSAAGDEFFMQILQPILDAGSIGFMFDYDHCLQKTKYDIVLSATCTQDVGKYTYE